MNLNVQISREELLSALDDMSDEELLKFVKDIDLERADWGFTLNLFKHFKKLEKQYKKEMKEIDTP